MHKQKQQVMVEVRKLFTDFLENKGQRKTGERFMILEKLYERNDHIDAEALYNLINKQQHNVSRATVYNTLELLVESGLVMRHQFGQHYAEYEKAYGYRQHDHIICTECKKVVEFCDPRIQQIKTKMGELLEFNITRHELHLYGLCADCEKSKKESVAENVKEKVTAV